MSVYLYGFHNVFAGFLWVRNTLEWCRWIELEAPWTVTISWIPQSDRLGMTLTQTTENPVKVVDRNDMYSTAIVSRGLSSLRSSAWSHLLLYSPWVRALSLGLQLRHEKKTIHGLLKNTRDPWFEPRLTQIWWLHLTPIVNDLRCSFEDRPKTFIISDDFPCWRRGYM